MLYDQIWVAVRWGHRKLAGALMEEQTKAGGGAGFGFGGNNWNQVHKDVSIRCSVPYLCVYSLKLTSTSFSMK